MRYVRAPFDAGFRVSGFLDRVGESEQLKLAKALLDPKHNIGTLPMDAPMVSMVNGVESLEIPSWSTARRRGLRTAGFQLLNFGSTLGTYLTLKADFRSTFTQVAAERLESALPTLYGPEIRLSGWDALLMLATGTPPISAGRLASATEDFADSFSPRMAVARHELQARVQLYRRTGDADYLDMSHEDLIRRRDGGLSAAALKEVGADSDPWGDPFPRMTTLQLLGHAVRSPTDDAKVWYNVTELEHGLGQRVPRAIDRLAAVRGVPRELGARLRRASGLTDPANVHLLSPFEHSMADVFAAYPVLGMIGRGERRLEEIQARIAAGNRSRMNKYGTVVGRRERETLAGADKALDVAKNASESVDDVFEAALEATAHTDAERALNAWVGAQPESVEQIIDALAAPEMMSAIAKSGSEVDRKDYVALAGQVMAAAELYYPSIAGSKAAMELQRILK